MKKIICIVVSLVIMCVLYGCKSRVQEEMKYSNNKNKTIEVEGGYYVQITMKNGKDMIESYDNEIILDVRTKEEYNEGHIPGAICIPNEEITDKEPKELPDKKQIIMVYCRSGNRSKDASKKLAEMGYKKVYEFGGIKDWDGKIEK